MSANGEGLGRVLTVALGLCLVCSVVVSGHRMGTMEIESALVANSLVAEAAVVGRPDDLTGEAICAFVVLKQARPSGE